ncbi:hypothetical protein N7526_006670 [Penicillium atrosanguineum]|nr:hypothetical protein N7526_006670 [Penicillium atrosanguineum]
MEERSKFKELPIEPHGIIWEDEFIDAEHEQRLISIFLKELKWPDRPGRISLHYGYTFDYKTFGIDPEIPYKEFPKWLQPLIPTTESRPPDQVSLRTVSWRASAYAVPQGEERVEVDLNPRSMMQMSGDSRLHWTHGIKKRKNDTLPDGTVRPRENRWSITYRWLREGGVCDCGNLQHCDTAQRRNGTEKEKRSLLELAVKANAEESVT